MQEEVKKYLYENFYTLTNKISNYLFKNNITDTHIFYERKEEGIILLGIKVSKGKDDDLNNYVIFEFTNIDNKINLEVNSNEKNKRPTLFLLRYFSNDILNFVMDMEYEIVELNLEKDLKLESNHILHIKEKTFDI